MFQKKIKCLSRWQPKLLQIIVFLLIWIHAYKALSSSQTTTLLTGHSQWNYYEIGKAFCNNSQKHLNGLRCQALASHGSAWNLEQIQQGNYKFAFAQSDIALKYMQSLGKQNNIRVVKKIKSQLYFILVREKDFRIHDINDLKNKNINLGPSGSGLNATNQIVLSAANLLNIHDSAHGLFHSITTFAAPKEASILCAGFVDAITYILETDSNGNVPRLRNIMQQCPMRILALSDVLIKKLLNLRLGYRKISYQQHNTIGLDMLLVGR